MEIDNSRANAFRTCPWLYYEQYERNGTGVEPVKREDDGYGPLQLGSRVHELMEELYKGLPFKALYPENPNAALESEAEWIALSYVAYYPNDRFFVVDVERTVKVRLPGAHDHVLTGKIDLVFQDLEDGLFYIMDHKTQQRSAKSNLPQKWAMRDQASLYLWAARHIYPKTAISNFIVNVLVRPSEKGQCGPSFLERQKLERTNDQLETAVRDIVYVADQIEYMRRTYGDQPWPSNREACYGWSYCDYYQPHNHGWSEEILRYKYKPKEEYLHLGGVEIIQPNAL